MKIEGKKPKQKNKGNYQAKKRNATKDYKEYEVTAKSRKHQNEFSGSQHVSSQRKAKKQIKKTQDELQWIVAQRLLSAYSQHSQRRKATENIQGKTAKTTKQKC